MTHRHVPTLPPFTPVYALRPKHRRSALSLVAAGAGDPPSEARCIATVGHVGICPRHQPADYCEHMARHASNVYGTGTLA